MFRFETNLALGIIYKEYSIKKVRACKINYENFKVYLHT